MPVADGAQNALPALRRLTVSPEFLRAADGSPLDILKRLNPYPIF